MSQSISCVKYGRIIIFEKDAKCLSFSESCGDCVMGQQWQKIRNELSPEWLRDCVMIDKKNNAIVINPSTALKHGINNLLVTQSNFTGRTIFKMRLDYDLLKIKKDEPIDNSMNLSRTPKKEKV